MTASKVSKSGRFERFAAATTRHVTRMKQATRQGLRSASSPSQNVPSDDEDEYVGFLRPAPNSSDCLLSESFASSSYEDLKPLKRISSAARRKKAAQHHLEHARKQLYMLSNDRVRQSLDFWVAVRCMPSAQLQRKGTGQRLRNYSLAPSRLTTLPKPSLENLRARPRNHHIYDDFEEIDSSDSESDSESDDEFNSSDDKYAQKTLDRYDPQSLSFLHRNLEKLALFDPNVLPDK